MNQEIPENWIKVKFKELAKQKSVRVDDPGESGYEKYVGLEHLDSGELVVKRYGSTSDVTSTMKLFEKDDILFARRNTYLRRVSVAPFDGVCSGDIIVLEPILKYIVEGFLPIFMQFEPFENKIIALSAGAFSKRIKWKQLAEEEIVIPSIEEQKKIVETIWSIQDNLNRIEKLLLVSRKVKEEFLNKLLTKGINHSSFKKTDYGDIPENWNVIKLSEIGEDKDSIVAGPFGSNLKVKDYKESGVPIIRLQNIERNNFILKDIKYISKEKADELSYHSYNEGDIVLAKLGDPIGKTCEVPAYMKNGIVTSDVVRIRVSSQKANKKFIEYMLNSPICNYQFVAKTVGSTRPRVNLSDVRDLIIFLPPISEQNEITDIFLELDRNIQKYQEHKNNIENLKLKVTNDFISGILKIPQEALQNVQ
ncbi:type I restriction enzyme, S subunit [Methanolobus vulcani]|uniref:Type I restriction enzyme, S subunit n=1 Tax=Methanolobus vulcani TaxID=38026 RepID=A0A7Z7B344_9EURY|nr:restriction endonuclease subunit S [Methanolobus vulcani]SDG15836.1 type I restriction enzyme, S subunit [Methanolobus vulcani]